MKSRLLPALRLYRRSLRQPKKQMPLRLKNQQRLHREECHSVAVVDPWEEGVRRHRISSMLG